ncbi:MAG: hypothetical protein FJ280_03190 [Planctomycetes bacterium]|nr:hypothetical protein [Planctomycetota bacterium]
MNSPGTNRCLIVLVLALLGPAAWADEPNEIPIRLEFELSPTPLGPYPSTRVSSTVRPLTVRRPPYAAAIPFVPPVEWLPAPERRTMSNFLGRHNVSPQSSQRQGYAEQQGGLSEQQKAFLQEAKSVFNYPTSNFVQRRLDPNGPEYILLFAVTREDAQKMAQAYYQYARNEWWLGYVRRLNTEIQEYAQTVAREETKVAELEQTLATAQKTLEDLGKTVPYRTEGEAHEAIGELDRMLNAAQVEIAGITAKIEAIQGYRQDKRAVRTEDGRVVPVPPPANPPETTARLNALFIEESIALRGAQARKQMATTLREQANRFLDLKDTHTNAAIQRETLSQRLQDSQNQLAIRRKQLEDTLPQEPKIPEKVTIYPVQWLDEPVGNE